MASLLLRVGVCSGKLEENCIFKSVLVLLLVEMGKQRVQNLSATLCCNYREQHRCGCIFHASPASWPPSCATPPHHRDPLCAALIYLATIGRDPGGGNFSIFNSAQEAEVLAVYLTFFDVRS
ncbi:hypothetical protein GEV33_006640 [Tenebrio molitor]|uniref:Uncharacterized protein n=1 Tax=Tenebrio molitor TaxID=7067 RepID=A0A8J6HJL7_TENMO|nr:hypothetical protein GEV33_006640 [Tenebrio molitor]